MSGTRKGGLLAAETNKARYGKDIYKEMGSKGGKTPTTRPKGFAADKNRARTAGAKGGRISRRAKTAPTITNPDFSSEISTQFFFSKSAKVRAFLRTITGRA